MASWERIPDAVQMAVQHCHHEHLWPLYLWGPTGSGKTCAAAVAFAVWRRTATWLTLTEMCDLLKGFNAATSQLIRTSDGQTVEVTLQGFWRRIESVDLVVIDEIGTRDATAHRYDSLLRLLDARKGKPLILTGNLDPVTALAAVYDERIQSRIAAGVLVNFKGRDQRLDGVEERIHVAE